MSTDLEIIPTIKKPVTWSDLKERWLAYLNEHQRQIIDSNIRLIRTETKETVDDNEALEIGGVYHFELDVPNTLGLIILTNEEAMSAGHELELIEDIGRNLASETIHEIAQKWNSVGYAFDLVSSAGRGKHELALMIALGSALASLCEGWVGVSSYGFGESLHMYTAEQFRKIQPDP